MYIYHICTYKKSNKNTFSISGLNQVIFKYFQTIFVTESLTRAELMHVKS